MPALSIPIPQGAVSVSEQASPMAPGKVQTANGLSGYKNSTALEDSIQKFLAPISVNARTRIWTAQDLSLYSNSEYLYAIFPIAIAVFWDRGGRAIVESEPLPLIFAILTHCLNKTATNNYSVRTKGQWFFQDAILIGSSPLATLEDFGKLKDGPNPRLAG